MLERTVERRFVQEAKRRGYLCYKFAFIGRRGAQDRLVLAPGGRIAFVELKRPGKTARNLQRWVHKKIRAYGFTVETIDTLAGVDAFFRDWPG